MPWSENDYPSSWKNLESITRRKAIDMGNAMLKNGYNEGDIIPIVTNQAKEWADQASEADKRKLRQKDITKHEKDKDDQGSTYIDKDIHVLYNDEEEHWEVKTLGAKQASDTFDTKQKAKERADEIAENRDTNVVTHKKSDDTADNKHRKNNVHVQYNNNEERWEVKTKGAKQPSNTYDTKEKAVNRAEEIAENRGENVVTHTKDEDLI